MPRVHVLAHEGRWEVRHERETDPIGIYSTQHDAEREAKLHARAHGDSEVVIHDRRGRVCDSETMDRARESWVRDLVR